MMLGCLGYLESRQVVVFFITVYEILIFGCTRGVDFFNTFRVIVIRLHVNGKCKSDESNYQ